MSYPGGPLAGIRVLDAAGMIAAPSACALMADMGADVIKLEPPHGDLLRGLIEFPDGPDPWWELDNRGKRGIAIDLSKAEGRSAAHAIAKSCDVFVTNFTIERQQRFELTPDDLRKNHVELIHTTLTGYGSTGPDQSRLAFDHTAFFSRGGVLDRMGAPGQTIPAGRAGQGDHTTSLAILSSILLALRERDLTGIGQAIEIALLQTAMWTLASDLSLALATGEIPEPRLRIETPSPLVGRFKCADDRWIMLTMAPEGRYWEKFCKAIGKTEWLSDPRFISSESRAERGAELMLLCDEVFSHKDRDTWGHLFDEAHLIWGAVHSLSEVINDPQAEALGAFVDINDFEEPLKTVAGPFHLAGSDIRVRGRAPNHGEHTQDILLEAGFSEQQVDNLFESKSVY